MALPRATRVAWADYRRGFLAALDASKFDATSGPPYPLPALTHCASARLSTEGGDANCRNLVGLPVGVPVAARPWREDVVLAPLGALAAHLAGRDSYPRCPAILGHQER